MTKRLVCTALLAAALASPAAAAGAGGPRLTIVGFSGKAGARSGAPPSDAVAPGKVYGTCRVADLARLYVFVRFSGMPKGHPTEVAWSRTGRAIFTDRFGWDLGRSGAAWFFLNRRGGSIADGHYAVEVRVDGRRLASAIVTRVTQYC